MNRPYQDYGPSSGTLFRQIADLNQNANLPFNYCVLGIQPTAIHVNSLITPQKARRLMYLLKTWLLIIVPIQFNGSMV